LFSKTQFHVVSTSHLQSINCKWFLHLREHFMFHTFSFSCFSLHLCLFLLFLTAIDLVMCVSMRNIAVSLWQVCSCLSLRDALGFFTLWCFLTSSNVFLYYTLRTMCNSSLGVWKNTLSVCLFIFICPFCSKKKKKRKKKFCYVFDWAWLHRTMVCIPLVCLTCWTLYVIKNLNLLTYLLD
jgi:hypothetical protein